MWINKFKVKTWESMMYYCALRPQPFKIIYRNFSRFHLIFFNIILYVENTDLWWQWDLKICVYPIFAVNYLLSILNLCSTIKELNCVLVKTMLFQSLYDFSSLMQFYISWCSHNYYGHVPLPFHQNSMPWKVEVF